MDARFLLVDRPPGGSGAGVSIFLGHRIAPEVGQELVDCKVGHVSGPARPYHQLIYNQLSADLDYPGQAALILTLLSLFPAITEDSLG